MEKTHKDTSDPVVKHDPVKTAAKPVKAPEPTSDEMYHSLHAMVIEAEADGRRDRPEVAKARELLQRHKLYPPEPPPSA